MPGSDAQSAFVTELAEEFIERYRNGEQPSLREYCDRYPHAAAEIRTVFPTIAMMERIAIADDLGPSTPDPKTEFTPVQLGDYRLLREIGRGGMGVVYEAEQTSLHRRVAVKILPQQFHTNERYKRRFEREAQAAAKLHHTNIVPVFGVGEHDNVPFYVMQLIPGLGFDVVLKQIWHIKNEQQAVHRDANATESNGYPLERQPFSQLSHSFLTGSFEQIDSSDQSGNTNSGEAEINASASELLGNSSSTGRVFKKELSYYHRVASLGVQINDALEYAHQQQIVHRDIKPSNLILDQRGKVWVTDFGLAKLTDQEDLTQTGDLLGTMRYMPPEALDGRADARSDVYSLGITLYEMLALKPAYDERDRGKLLKQLAGDSSPNLLKSVPEIPRDLATIIHKAIEREPSARYQSPSEFGTDLRLFLEDRPILARQANVYEQLGRWGRRNPALAALTGITAVLLITTLAIFAVGNYRLTRALQKVQSNLDRAESAERESRLREADALVGKARGFRLSRREGQRIAALTAIDQAATIGRETNQPYEWFAPLRNEAIAALSLPDLHVENHWPGNPKGTKEVCVSGNHLRYVRISEQGELSVRSVEGDKEIAKVKIEPGSSTVALNRNGTVLACWRATLPVRTLQFWKIADSECVEVFHTEYQDANPSHFSFIGDHDPATVIIAMTDGEIVVVDLDKGVVIKTLAPMIVASSPDLRVHPSKPLVVISSYSTNSVVVRNYETGEIVVTETPPWSGGSTAAWHPSGKQLCIGRSDAEEIRFYAFDELSAKLSYERSIPFGHGHTQLVFNPSGDRFFATGWAPGITMGNYWTGERLFGTRTVAFGVSGGDGKVGLGLVSEEATHIGTFTVAEGKELRSIMPSSMNKENRCYDFAIHPDGRLIVINFLDAIHFFDIETGRELAFLDRQGSGPKEVMTALSFDRNGSLYANSFAGCFRIPVKSDPNNCDHLLIGPPEALPFHTGWEHVSASADGSVVAQPMYTGYEMLEFAGGWIAYKDQPLRWVGRGRKYTSSSVSQDGRWVAFNSLYDAKTGKLEFEKQGEILKFSSNSRCLLGGGLHSHAYEIGTWKEVADLGDGAVVDLTPDGKMAILIMPSTNDTFRLVEVATGRELARLQSPEQSVGISELTPDGNQIVFQSDYRVCIWDLRRVRQRLADIGLDWTTTQESSALGDVPEVKAKNAIASPSTGTLTVKLVGMDLLKNRAKRVQTERIQLLYPLFTQPWNPTHYSALGRHCMREGAFDTAYWLYSAAIALGAESYVYQYRAEAAFHTDRWRVLVSDVDRCLNETDNPGTWRLRRALALRCLGKYKEAILDLNEAIKESPISRFYCYRGECREALGQMDEANADYDAAAKLEPITPRDVNNLAWRMLTGPKSQRMPDRGYQLIQKSYSSLEKDATFLNTIGIASFRVGKYQEALEILSKSLAMGNGESDAFDLYFICMCHAQLGDIHLATESFRQADHWFNANRNNMSETSAVELQQFRFEAARLLGGAGSAD